jgi:hypothetical protein
MTQTYIKGAVKGNQDGGARPLRDTPMQIPAASREMNYPSYLAVIYVGQWENKFPHFISVDRVELVGCHCVLCPQAAFLVCCGMYDHRAGDVGAELC